MPIHTWQKSSYCGEGDSCVNVAAAPTGTIHLTESSDPARAVLGTTPHAFSALLRTLKEETSRG
ncbi:DUF397 domain-containing protein [Streptomyces sporangiiformans]|uniref:DUF397 domain-containing protein n=1 Tax=Streptomyces sporangiiformans TaxID=2315329 RepID=A0A505D8I4_9ACTN|nr:DUF397 domain-containing protein [Streptomyces sporangiiformans]TPQ17038.1 DUF397 domain-containing protein [Streptomyces sporangiiformans]